MLVIVYDLGPGAQLYFATAFNGISSFASNIAALAAAGCTIIVDDVFYLGEPTFQDGEIAQAVNDFTDAGGLYFSSAGNSGNLNDGRAACGKETSTALPRIRRPWPALTPTTSARAAWTR
jgi:hypothetical protein